MCTNSIRLLLVDDNRQVRENLASMLELAGSKEGTRIESVGQACNGLEGMKAARRLRPDVILMDLEMPVLDGFEATRRIKAEMPGTRVVILTIHAGPAEWERARAAGADGFVAKGADPRILLNAILGKDEPTNPFDFNKGEKP